MNAHEQDAYNLGVEHAKNAASWAIDGNTDPDNYRRLLAMMDDGDPAAWDYLPEQPNLSGEWADSMTPARLLEDLGLEWEDTPDETLEAVYAYEEGVQDTFYAECERILRSALED